MCGEAVRPLGCAPCVLGSEACAPARPASPSGEAALRDCPSNFHRSGIARAAFVAQGLPEHLWSLRDRLSTFFGGYFLLPLDHLILLDYISIDIHQS
jgi:hypothetical protein